MNKKKRMLGSIGAVLVLIAGVFAFLVFYGGFPEIHTQKNQYRTWEKFAGYSGLKVFPESIKEENIENYYYKSQDTIFSPECQVYLEAFYDDEMFEKEVERLSKISVTYQNKKNLIIEDNENFHGTAYVCEYNWNHCYEYAVISKENKKISYIFLQNVKKEDIKFDSDSLPLQYGENAGQNAFCIYAFGIGKNEIHYDY